MFSTQTASWGFALGAQATSFCLIFWAISQLFTWLLHLKKKQRKPWGNAAMPKIPKSTLDFPQMFVLITSIFFWRYLEFHRVTKMLDHIFSTKPVEDPGYYRNNIQNIVPYLDTDKLSATVLELSVPKSH